MGIREAIIELASKDVGIKEIMQNKGWEGEDGSILREEMENIGWKEGQAYCAFWSKKIWVSAYRLLGAEDIAGNIRRILSGNAQECYKKAQIARLRVNGDPAPGAIGVMELGGTSRGHTVIVKRVINGTLIETYEANTNISGQREGDGIYIKRRNVSFVKKTDGLYFLGFIHPVEVKDATYTV